MTKAFRSQNIITSNVAFSQELLGSVHWFVMGYKKKSVLRSVLIF